MAESPTRLENLRTRLRVAAGRPDLREGYRWNRLAHPQARSDWVLHRVRASVEALAHRRDFAQVRRYCFFIGYQRSGHSLIGSLLNAHPDVVIAHELGAVPYVAHGFSRNQLFAAVLHRDRDFAAFGRKWTGYEYAVPHQHQGTFRRLQVVGDKFGGTTAVQIAAEPALLDRLRQVVEVPLRVLHVTRNPYDNIATLSGRMHVSLADATDRYARLCRAVAAVATLLGPEELLTVDYDAFVAAPAQSLARICTYLDVEAEPAYLADCAGIVWPSTRRTREKVSWTEAERHGVMQLTGTYPWLGQYHFDD